MTPGTRRSVPVEPDVASLTRLLGSARLHEQLTSSDVTYAMSRTPAFDEQLFGFRVLEFDRDSRSVAWIERADPPERARRRYDPADLCSASAADVYQRLAPRQDNRFLGRISHNRRSVSELHIVSVGRPPRTRTIAKRVMTQLPRQR
jgi:hypothetical protein